MNKVLSGIGGGGGGAWRGGGFAARTLLMTRLVCGSEKLSFLKGKTIRRRLVLLCLDHCSDLVKLSPTSQSMLDKGGW